MANQNSISLGIKLQPSKEVQGELDSLIGQLEKNSNINLKIDTKQVTQSLKDFSNTLNNISNKMKSGFNFQGVFTSQSNGIKGITNNLKEEQKTIEQTANTMKTLSNTKIQVLNDDGSIKETLKDITKLQDGINKTVTLTEDLKNKTKTLSTTDNSGNQEIANKKAMYKSMFDEIANAEKDSIKDKTQMYGQMFDTMENRQKQYSKLFDEANAKELKMTEQIANANEKTQINRNNSSKNDELKQAEAINKALEDNYKAYLKLGNVKATMQSKLNTASKNDFIDTSVITNLQNKLNGINTNTADKEIKELQATINNLGSSDSQIVRLQNTISKMENNLTSMKGKYGSLVGDSSSKTELNSYISQVEKLKTTLSSLQSGGNISGSKLASELNKGTEASRNLSTAVKNSGSALKTANQDATTFGNGIKRALENAGIYMSVYQGIRMVSQSIKEGIGTVISMDSSLGNLNKVVSMSKEQLLQMRDSAVEMGKELGRSSIEIANAQAEFGRLYKTQDEINAMTKASVMGANVMDGVSSAEVAKGLTTTISSMKLEASDSMTILDSMNEIKCVSPYIVIYK